MGERGQIGQKGRGRAGLVASAFHVYFSIDSSVKLGRWHFTFNDNNNIK